MSGASPWATSDDDIADARLERMLGPYSESICREWVPSDRFLADVPLINLMCGLMAVLF